MPKDNNVDARQTSYEEQRLTDSQASRTSSTSVLRLDASERLYQPISLFKYCYLHIVNNRLYITLDYKLGHKPILICRSTRDTELKITVKSVCRSMLCVHITALILRNACFSSSLAMSYMSMLFKYNLCAYKI